MFIIECRTDGVGKRKKGADVHVVATAECTIFFSH